MNQQRSCWCIHSNIRPKKTTCPFSLAILYTNLSILIGATWVIRHPRVIRTRWYKNWKETISVYVSTIHLSENLDELQWTRLKFECHIWMGLILESHLRVKMFWGNITIIPCSIIYQHWKMLVVIILLHRRQGSYHLYIINACLLMIWRRNEPKHRQPRYWLVISEYSGLSTRMVNIPSNYS